MFIDFDRIHDTNVTDGQADTAPRYRPRFCIVLCGKRVKVIVMKL